MSIGKYFASKHKIWTTSGSSTGKPKKKAQFRPEVTQNMRTLVIFRAKKYLRGKENGSTKASSRDCLKDWETQMKWNGEVEVKVNLG